MNRPELKIQFWGYRHTNGKLLVKRYFSKEDLSEAIESPFVEAIFGPFPAKNVDEAQRILFEMNERG